MGMIEEELDEQIRILREDAHMWAEEARAINDCAEERVGASRERIKASEERVKGLLKQDQRGWYETWRPAGKTDRDRS